MAIYHLEAKVISRGTGRSVVAASAYMSCSKLYNDYDGIEHDYTRKHGLVHQEIMLPTNAPTEWSDREKLWNAVEEAEKPRTADLHANLSRRSPSSCPKMNGLTCCADISVIISYQKVCALILPYMIQTDIILTHI